MTLDQAAHLMDAVALGESGFHPSDKLVKRLERKSDGKMTK